MKLFKISIISIISILIFQSQLYGINLSCDFKRKVNKIDYNGVSCSQDIQPFCKIQEIDILDWVSEVFIKDKNVIIFNELPTFLTNDKTQEEIRESRERHKEVLILESVVHNLTGLEGTEDEVDRYMFVFRGGSSYVLYSLFFDNLSKESYLTEHISFNKLKFSYEYHKTTFNTYLGKCEIE
jgi:hypothetical protein